jgi:Ca2+-binding RTX toxin-like protein
VTELANEGMDTVRSTIGYALTDNVENLILAGSANVNATGNGLVNVLTGNVGNNILDGKAGADVMAGAAGNDTYHVDNAGDQVQEAVSQGTDTVVSSVSYSLGGQYTENLTLTGSANLNATGNGLANTLTGNFGNNVLNGNAGADVMRGGGGSDSFVFSTALVAGTIDTITDFSVGDDRIRLSAAVFNTIAGTGTLSAAQFVANASGTAQDANDRIIYETDTGKLFFDSNGSAAGGAVQFATVSPGLALTNARFSVF